jgi:hypothetical protein
MQIRACCELGVKWTVWMKLVCLFKHTFETMCIWKHHLQTKTIATGIKNNTKNIMSKSKTFYKKGKKVGSRPASRQQS